MYGQDLSDAMINSGKFKIKDKRYKDVTKEYFEEATPGRGNIDKEQGYIDENNEKEINVAKILHKELGGDIFLINDNNRKEGQHIPDYKWNEALWDLKSPEKIRSLDKRIQTGIHQIEKAPGGIVVNLPKTITFDEMVEITHKRWLSTGRKFMSSLDIIIIQNGKISRIVRFDK